MNLNLSGSKKYKKKNYNFFNNKYIVTWHVGCWETGVFRIMFLFVNLRRQTTPRRYTNNIIVTIRYYFRIWRKRGGFLFVLFFIIILPREHADNVIMKSRCHFCSGVNAVEFSSFYFWLLYSSMKTSSLFYFCQKYLQPSVNIIEKIIKFDKLHTHTHINICVPRDVERETPALG